MRKVKLEKEVEDISGLYFELVERGFELVSVSVHERCTYVNVEDEEDKDPLPFMESFAGQPFKAPSRSITEKRREICRKFVEEKPLRMENLRARFRVSQEVKAIRPDMSVPSSAAETMTALEDRPIEVLALPGPAKPGFLKKLRSLF